jgi:two-component system chemotaxis response regulator CheB
MIKVLIVDDSSFIRSVVREMLSSDFELNVVGEAADGKDALNKTEALHPDVICLDIIMPSSDGIWALREIRKLYNIPVVIFSRVTSPTAEITAEVFRMGVIDIVQKPGQTQMIRTVQRELIEKIKLAAAVDREKLKRHYGAVRLADTEIVQSRAVVVIGSSAGGPPAVYELLSMLSKELPISIVVAQHLPQAFVPAFAEHLKKFIPFASKVAEDGDVLSIKRILVSPAERTALVQRIKNGGVIQLEKIEGHARPSINAVLSSVAECYGKNAIGVILSGMGNDGSEGLRRIKELGGKTIVQDEGTSLVWGMPRAAQQAGVADFVLPVSEMAAKIAELVRML